eukprot:365387-Chlamydomonas_euryale.AAC.17
MYRAITAVDGNQPGCPPSPPPHTHTPATPPPLRAPCHRHRPLPLCAPLATDTDPSPIARPLPQTQTQTPPPLRAPCHRHAQAPAQRGRGGLHGRARMGGHVAGRAHPPAHLPHLRHGAASVAGPGADTPLLRGVLHAEVPVVVGLPIAAARLPAGAAP